MSCPELGRSFYFTLLTLITIGASAALLITLVAYFVKLKLKNVSSGLFAGLVIAMCVALLLLFYAFYASVRGNACHKTILSLVYLIFALALGALGIAVLALKQTIINGLGDYWNEHEPEMGDLEKQLNCLTWDNATKVEGTGNETCKTVFNDFYNKFGKGIGAGLVVLFVILLVGDIFAWKFVCDKFYGRERLGDGGDGSKQLTAPLTYSW